MRYALSIDWYASHTDVLRWVGKPLNDPETANLFQTSSPSRHTHVLSHPDIQGRAQAHPRKWKSKGESCQVLCFLM